MLFVNERLHITTNSYKAEGKYFSINQVFLGETGPGQQVISLAVPKTVKKIMFGMNPDLSIGYTESFKPRIHLKESEEVFMLLTSKGTNTSGINTIQIPASQKNEIYMVRRGNGHENQKYWGNVLFRFNKSGIVRIHTADDKDDDVFVVCNGRVTCCSIRTLKSVCRFKKMDLPKSWVNIA